MYYTDPSITPSMSNMTTSIPSYDYRNSSYIYKPTTSLESIIPTTHQPQAIYY
jgi:hypothetical protein